MNNIVNPILRGFHPDPSIVRVGEDYYIATSTFHWSPGVAIYHSCDLQNWTLAARPLDRLSQLDLCGVEPGGGVFAPCLSYCEGMFFLLYTNVRSHLGEFMDCRNFLTQATDIAGPWSEPVYLHSVGFDPSLFHEDNGNKWVVSVLRRCRSDENAGHMAGIVLQQYNPETRALAGPLKRISMGSGLSGPEGPHLYQRNGKYYLLAAEGGTEYGHAATMFRADNIWGPYEQHPHNPVLTARDDLALPLQRAGHADIVDTPAGETYMVYLCGRPLPPFRRCVLGRETAIQKAEWREDNWLYLLPQGRHPSVYTPAPKGSKPLAPGAGKISYSFVPEESLHSDFMFLRNRPDGTLVDLTARPGCLRLTGQDSPHSRFTQTLVARRQQAFCFTAETGLEFNPVSERQMAGLTYIYDENNFYYAHITCNWQGARVLMLMHMERGRATYIPARGVALPREGAIWLRLAVRFAQGCFSWSAKAPRTEADWLPLSKPVDASVLSDEYPYGGTAAYTGAMVGMACHDMQYRNAKADFLYFTYTEHDEPGKTWRGEEYE